MKKLTTIIILLSLLWCTTAQATDTTPPSVPAGLTATAVSTSQVDLTWNPSTDDVGVVGYIVYREGVAVNSTVNTWYSDTGLVSGTLYNYMVSARDAANNHSAKSGQVSVRTLDPSSYEPTPGSGTGKGEERTLYSPNLIENSSFEVGFSSQWGLGLLNGAGDTQPFLLSRYLDQTQAYEGKASLKLASDKRYQNQNVLSKMYRLKPNQTYVLSLYAKATQDPGNVPRFSVQISNTFNSPYGPGDSSGKQIFRASADWQRFSLVFTTADVPGRTTYQLCIMAEGYEAPGFIWIDAIQLEEGSTPTEYKPRAAAEVSVLVPESHPGKVFFEDEQVLLQLWQFNHSPQPFPVQIHYEVYDYYNRLVKNDIIAAALSAASLSQQNLQIALPENKRGIFRVLCWIAGLEGTMGEVVYTVIPRPRQGLNAEDSIIGSHVPYEAYPLSMMQKIGMRWNCDLSTGNLFRWSLVEPTLGAFKWYDDKAALSKQYGLEILGTLGYAVFTVPNWARYFDTSVPLTFQVNSESSITVTKAAGIPFSTLFRPQDEIMVVRMGANRKPIQFVNNGVYRVEAVTADTLSLRTIYKKADRVYANETINEANLILLANPLEKRGWQHFVESMVSHYKDKVKYWAVWSEPDTEAALSYCPEGYAALLKISYTEAKAVDPEAKIVGMEASYHIFINSVVDIIGPDYMDIISSHIYPLSAGGIQRLINLVYSKYPDKPVWNTQTGVGKVQPFYHTLLSEDVWGMGGSREDTPLSSDHYQNKDALIVRNFAQTIGSGYFKRYIYYDSRETTALNFFRTYSPLDWDLSLKPKGVVLAMLAQLFNGSRGEGPAAIHPDITAYSFKRDTTPLLVLWNKYYDPSLFPNNPYAPVNIPPVYVTPRLLRTSLPAASIKAYNVMGNELPIQSGVVMGTDPIYIEGINVSKEELMNSLSVTVEGDSEVPTISLVTFPTGNSNGKNLLFRWHSSDNATPAWRLTNVNYPEVVYSYQLQGYDAAWTAWVTERSVTYSDVPQGRYCFVVKARDAEGNESQTQREVAVGEQGISYGDVSGDGTITAYDAALVAQYAVGLFTPGDEAQFKGRADVSGDGQVSAYDAALIAQRAIGLIGSFPVEG